MTKTQRNRRSERNNRTVRDKVLSGIGIALCVVFGVMLICNLVIIIKGELYPERPPSVAGFTPMVVLSGSMSGTAEGHIEVGDLIFVGKADPEELQVGDVIAYMDGTVVVTHRITEVSKDENGSIQFITKGDANNTADSKPVSASKLVGIYKGRIPELGNFVLFMQEPIGMLLFIGLPILLFVLYDALRRQKYNRQQQQTAEDMKAELERLRAMTGEEN